MISSHLTHAVAWCAVRAVPLQRTLAVTRTVARIFGDLSEDEARTVARRLRGGTCLTKALAVAARLPRAEVAIGGEKRGAFSAHAWVELEGQPLSVQTTHQTVLVRLRRSGAG